MAWVSSYLWSWIASDFGQVTAPPWTSVSSSIQWTDRSCLDCLFRAVFDPWVGRIPWRRAWQCTPVFLPGESPWTEEPRGLQSMGLQRVGHKWATKHSTGITLPHHYHFVVALIVRMLKLYSHSDFPVHGTVLWTIVTILRVRSPELIIL